MKMERPVFKKLVTVLFLGSVVLPTIATALQMQVTPKPPGKLVDLAGHRLQVHCTGSGSPTVVVENGLGDYSFDWVLVQRSVSQFTRICTYDRR